MSEARCSIRISPTDLALRDRVGEFTVTAEIRNREEFAYCKGYGRSLEMALIDALQNLGMVAAENLWKDST